MATHIVLRTMAAAMLCAAYAPMASAQPTAPVAPVSPVEPTAPVAMPAWMAGAWIMRAGENRAEEYWTPADGGVMIGAGKSFAGDRLRSFEHMRIAPGEDGRLHFFASPDGAPFSAFAMVEQGDGNITFANPAHDYPQRIRYWREGDTLNAEISLADGSRPMRWRFTRMGS